MANFNDFGLNQLAAIHLSGILAMIYYKKYEHAKELTCLSQVRLWMRRKRKYNKTKDYSKTVVK